MESETFAEPALIATACAVSGETAVVAYSAPWKRRGPSGETRQAFVLRSDDRGASWCELPLCRTAFSLARHWGFPVWPPERIHGVELRAGGLEIAFADEHVIFEPGGESLWTGTLADGTSLWTVARVRELDYDGADVGFGASAIALRLPDGFAAPDPAWLERIAQRVASDAPFQLSAKIGWLVALPIGVAALSRSGALLALGLLLYAIGTSLGPLLIERRRVRAGVRSSAWSPERSAP